MKEHQNVHQVINQTPTVLGLPLYRKATTPTRLSPKTGRSRSPLDDCGCLSRGIHGSHLSRPESKDGTQILSKKRTPPFDGRVKGG